MKKWILAIAMLVMCGIGVSVNGAVPRSIVGATGECNLSFDGCTAIPLTLSSVCSTSCPRQTRPSYTDVNRMWGSALGGSGVCRTSIDGGVTWVSCTTQPFTSGGKENYAGAADGSVIGTGRVGAECRIERSINNATSWTRVYTGADTCGGGLAGPTQLFCLMDGSCTFIFNNSGGRLVVLRSTDNGQNWAITFTSGTTAGFINAVGFNNDWDVAIPAISIGLIGISGVSASYVNSAVLAPNVICWGGFMLGSSGFGMCHDALTTYKVVTMSLGTTTFSPVLAGAVVGVDIGGVSFGLGSSTVYTIASWNPSGTLRIGTWVSRDSGSTYTLLGTSTVAGSGMREGDMWQHPLNGCVYWSAGGIIQVMKIC